MLNEMSEIGSYVNYGAHYSRRQHAFMPLTVRARIDSLSPTLRFGSTGNMVE